MRFSPRISGRFHIVLAGMVVITGLPGCGPAPPPASPTLPPPTVTLTPWPTPTTLPTVPPTPTETVTPIPLVSDIVLTEGDLDQEYYQLRRHELGETGRLLGSDYAPFELTAFASLDGRQLLISYAAMLPDQRLQDAFVSSRSLEGDMLTLAFSLGDPSGADIIFPQPLEGFEEIGEVADARFMIAGPDGDRSKIDMVVFRRGAVGLALIYSYPLALLDEETQSPPLDLHGLAILLDERLLAALSE